MNNKWLGILVALVIVLVLAWCAWQLSLWATTSLGDFGKALEYPLWAAILGLVANAVTGALKIKDWLKPGLRTELFIKIGLVLLGTTININTVLRAGGGGVVQGVFMVTAVFLFSWWLGGVFKLSDTMRAVMSTAIAICGVSAAIAAAGSVLAKKEELAYITALVIVTALPLMVIMPYLAQAMNLSPTVAGAWFGGNIDTTAAVVGAGTIHSKKAQEIASIVKMSQNALMGLVAFLLAVYFVTVIEKGKERPSPKVIWDRFPKFVLGFIVASILVSIVDAKGASLLFTSDALGAMSNLRNWFFALAFVCIGFELDVSQLKAVGGAPFWCYMIVTVFNTVLALIVAQIIFGMLFPV